MVFPTLSFLIFYLVVWPLSWAAVALRWHRVHKLVVILASYVFYSSWNTRIAALLLASVLLNWLAGRLIDAHHGRPVARWIVSVAVAINIGILGFFKYSNFFVDSLNELLTSLGMAREIPNLDTLLPLRLSFFTFRGVSSFVGLYRGDLARP